MTASTVAFHLFKPAPDHGGMAPEPPPGVIWGQGTPGAIEPFTIVNKGAIYMQTDATDDIPCVWMKVDEGGDAADWVLMDGQQTTMSALFDISAADSEQVVLYADRALLITSAYLLWNEATGASGAAEGDIAIGTASAGGQIVATDAYDVSKASGSIQALTIADGAVTAAGSVFASHDTATGANGTYFLVLKWHYTA